MRIRRTHHDYYQNEGLASTTKDGRTYALFEKHMIPKEKSKQKGFIIGTLAGLSPYFAFYAAAQRDPVTFLWTDALVIPFAALCAYAITQLSLDLAKTILGSFDSWANQAKLAKQDVYIHSDIPDKWVMRYTALAAFGLPIFATFPFAIAP